MCEVFARQLFERGDHGGTVALGNRLLIGAALSEAYENIKGLSFGESQVMLISDGMNYTAEIVKIEDREMPSTPTTIMIIGCFSMIFIGSLLLFFSLSHCFTSYNRFYRI